MSNDTQSQDLSTARPRFRQLFHKIGWWLWGLGVAFLFGLYWFPIRFGSLRLAIVLTIVALWGSALALLWRLLPLRLALIVSALCVIVVVLWPSGSRNDTRRLQSEYLQALRSYEGTVYVWGGENRRGIDCSGLVRRGFIDANLKVGLGTFEPALIKQGAELWWYDCSAKALKEEYRQQTRLVCRIKSLNQADYSQLHPGDIAVTDSGVHTLAYLGDSTWIQADPGAWRVIKETAPSKNAWFSMPMHIMRWRQLDGA